MKVICVLGAESTGTTTLSKDLATYFKTSFVSEYGREYFEKNKKMNDKWKSNEFFHIAGMQNLREAKLRVKNPPVLICDTNSFATSLWHKRYMGYFSKKIEQLFKNRKYDLYILTNTDIPFVQDGTRDGEKIRLGMHKEFVQKVKKTKIPFIIVSGSKKERLKKSIEAIELLETNNLEKIQSFLQNKKVTKLERKRLNQDLETIYERLSKKEYTRGSFTSNKFDIANKTQEVYANVNFYKQIGKTWEKIFLAINIIQFKNVAILCPGYSPKVELGLYYANYKGQVIVIDVDSKSLIQLKRFLQIFNYQFKLILKRQNLFKKSKQKYDLIAANHLFDDLILYYFANKKGILLNQIYEKEENLINLWEYIFEKENQNLEEIVPIISDSLDSLVKENGLICIAQYKSYTDKMLNLEEANIFTRKVFKKVKKILIGKNYSDESSLLSNPLKTYKGHFSARDVILLRKK
jgi:nicotinamide riboside kinase